MPAPANLCDPTDLVQYLPAAVVKLASPSQQLQACADATEEAYSYMRGRYPVPFVAWGNDVRKYTAWIACYLLMSTIGFAPTNGSDRVITERYYQAVGNPGIPGSGWFPGVQRQSIHPDVTLSAPVDGTKYQLPQVRSQPPRGWQEVRNGKPVV